MKIVWCNGTFDILHPGPVVGDELVLYVDSKRLKNLIELQQEKLLIDIEKNTKIKL